MSYFVYILSSKRNGTLYIGVTNDISRRVYEHKTGSGDGFTKKYKVNRLVYVEEYLNVTDAIAREKALKGSSRARKIKLIESVNAEWEDLYDSLT